MKERIGNGLFYILSVVSLFLFIVAADYTVYTICKDILKLKVVEILLLLVGVTMFIVWFLFRGLSLFRNDRYIIERS
jgi:hypothetical protein